MKDYPTIKEPPEEPRVRFLRYKELRRIIPLSRSTIWKMTKDGTFPRSYRIGTNARAWRENDIQTWINERAQENNQHEDAERRPIDDHGSDFAGREGTIDHRE